MQKDWSRRELLRAMGLISLGGAVPASTWANVQLSDKTIDDDV